ncbi:class I adenylate-forming enzyme family protein [Longivirga aurantiaca]|uniref:Class I adenylate-forming enzyme family protein n=1 Tax=Longivirga aurantiaca TaxID=1837743 RepID=A0ABW1T5X0_9ACTN
MSTFGSTLVSWIGAVARAHPNDPALIFEGDTWTYKDLWHRSASISRELLAKGLRRGESVGLVGANEAVYVATYFGIMRAGATAVPLNAMLDVKSLREQLELVEATSVFVGHVAEGVRDELAESFRVLPMHGSGAAVSRSQLPAVRTNTPCSIMLTSGSTGKPKGAVHTQGTMLHAALQLGSMFPFGPGQRGVVFLPLYACIPEQVLPMLCMGGALEILPRFDIERIADACLQATTFDAVPTVMGRLIEHAPLDKLAHLEWVLFASEAMPTALINRWWEELPNVETHQFYGMTEILPLTAASHRMLRAEPTTVGRAFPTTSIRVQATDGFESLDGSGELVGMSPARMLGYYNDDPATARAVSTTGGMHTGDIGRIDENGFVYLTGRLKDIIITGGINVSPGEIEHVACHHPDVLSAIVVGLQSQRWGETPVVVAVAKPGRDLSADELLRYCRSNLASYKRPSGAAVVTSLPTTGIGKAAKESVKQMIMDGVILLVHA